MDFERSCEKRTPRQRTPPGFLAAGGLGEDLGPPFPLNLRPIALSSNAVGSRYDDLNREELVRLLQARDRRDATRFGLVWEANEIERDKTLNSGFVALDLVPDLCVGSEPWRNLIIEGDNYDALRYLRMTFAGRVKCILIDPPYNTGSSDFIYNDRFVDNRSSERICGRFDWSFSSGMAQGATVKAEIRKAESRNRDHRKLRAESRKLKR